MFACQCQVELLNILAFAPFRSEVEVDCCQNFTPRRQRLSKNLVSQYWKKCISKNLFPLAALENTKEAGLHQTLLR